ncbi:MAG TPA: alpha/beta fold hydrolase [Vicinamibacterales bacterium]|jgi:dipeptidyl aminopeptidase/acylaminoacyl peptidase
MRASISVAFILSFVLAVNSRPLHSQTPTLPAGSGAQPQPGQFQQRPPDFDRMLQQQADTDKTWKAASEGFMQVEKITYRSKVGDMDIPAFVFQPLKPRGPHGHPALVWVHENIRGHLYEHYVPYIREAVAKGYVVIAPEYRGSIGYGKEFYDAIDYGGNEVDDVVTAVDVLKAKYPVVDPARIGIIGWSHGGMITLLSILRNQTMFKAAVAMVPVTNLFQRLAWKGVERQHQAIDPANRYGGLPVEKHDVYKERSPLYNVDKLEIPLYVGVTRNDEDVNIEEDMQLVDALRSRKPFLATTTVYDNPLGGHTFDRRVDPKTFQPENTREQRDSWNRVWTFLDWQLDPFHDAATAGRPSATSSQR